MHRLAAPGRSSRSPRRSTKQIYRKARLGRAQSRVELIAQVAAGLDKAAQSTRGRQGIGIAPIRGRTVVAWE